MHPKMSEDKTTAGPAIIFTANEGSPEVVTPKPRPYRKYVIIAVTGVVVVAIVLTAILVGLYLSHEAQKAIVKYSYNRDKDTKEDMTSDPNTNIVQYHARNPNYEMWVVNDFNRDIQVLKIHMESDTNCYVAPLNRTIAMDPSKVSAPSDIMKKNTIYEVTFRSYNSPIPDTSFLSKTAKDTCKGISIYWVYPSCDAPDNPADLAQRQKRGRWCWRVCILWRCWRRCR